MIKIVNLTPYQFNIYNDQEVVIATFPRSGHVLQLKLDPQIELKDMDVGFPISIVTPYKRATAINVTDKILDILDGCTHIIVTDDVGLFLEQNGADNILMNKNIIGPDFGPDGIVKDKTGKIKGTKRFVKYNIENMKYIRLKSIWHKN